MIWRGVDRWLAEVASIDLQQSGVRATGTQLGDDPVPYRLDYTLDASEDFITQSISAFITGDGWSRGVRLAHDGTGGWQCDSECRGDVDLPTPGGDTRALAGAHDCDLGFSPLTNLMPIRRLSLHRQPSSADLLMAWISVPDLGVFAYPQRYEHIRADATGAVVRFTSLGIHEGFTSELRVDRDGLVLVYPHLAIRVGS